ncbi:SDR family NAD(P)-dependent oxidoreductase [Pseudonocardia acaciae]|uniref:SDR family NAD(P)-dependent oxidoreductase n=1 Tax=Pseudonocardia acaciae TaxID=551276 RepID=UPI0007E8BD28|nr:glucose 1-dehydrogenase [Pseudonocardia acaciae]
MDAAVVTGGGSGIGRATVLRLLAAGRPVVLAEVNERSAEETLRLAGDAPVEWVRTDVRSEDDVAAALEFARERFGRLGCVVNNAGVGGAFGPITELDSDDWDYTFQILVRAVFYGLKHGARIMREQGGGGSVVNVASVAAFSSGLGPTAYSSAKAAVINLTRCAAAELAPDRIRVNAVCPGAIHTPLLVADRTEGAEERLAGMQPWPDHGRPDHIAAAIAFLAGEDAGFVTGESLVVDGGMIAAGPGPLLAEKFGTDPRLRGLVGVNHGSTGRESVVRRRVSDQGTAGADAPAQVPEHGVEGEGAQHRG